MTKVINKIDKYQPFNCEGKTTFAVGVRNYSKYVATLVNKGTSSDIRRWLFAVRHEQGKVNDLTEYRMNPDFDYQNYTKKGGLKRKEIKERRNIVTVCSKYALDNSKPVSIREANKKHHYHNLVACGAVWLCTICSYRILKVRETEVQTVFNDLREQGKELYMITLTVPHKANDRQAYTLQLLLKGWRYLLQSPQGKAFKKEFPFWIRGTESRHGLNGMHPHIHLIFASESDVNDNYVIEQVRAKWSKLTGANMEKGFFVSYFNNDDYIFQSVKEVSKAYEKAQANEITGTIKLGDSIDSMHLAMIDKDLYKEYAKAIKGTKRLQRSEAFKALQNELAPEKTDSEILNTAVSDTDLLQFTPRAWNEIKHKYDDKAQIINHLNNDNYEKLESLLNESKLLISPDMIILYGSSKHDQNKTDKNKKVTNNTKFNRCKLLTKTPKNSQQSKLQF